MKRGTSALATLVFVIFGASTFAQVTAPAPPMVLSTGEMKSEAVDKAKEAQEKAEKEKRKAERKATQQGEN